MDIDHDKFMDFLEGLNANGLQANPLWGIAGVLFIFLIYLTYLYETGAKRKDDEKRQRSLERIKID